MAEQQADEQQASQAPYNPLNFLKAPFPAPPPFWRHFTTTNLARLDELSNSGDNAANKPTFELAVLRPPPPPTTGEYRAFDRPNQVHPRADPPPAEILLFDPASPRLNPAVVLTRLTKSLLLNFLELTTIMSENPSERTEKIQDIRRLMINVHAVINMYRPHQARESVKERLEGMLEDGEREMEQCEAVKERVRDFLTELHAVKARREGRTEQSNGFISNTGTVETEDEQLAEARRLWGLIHEIAEE